MLRVLNYPQLLPSLRRPRPRNLRSLCFIKPGKSKPRAGAKGASLRSDTKQTSIFATGNYLASALLKQALQSAILARGGCPNWKGQAAIGVEGSFASHPLKAQKAAVFLRAKVRDRS